jgi:hypothetical protein
MSVSPKMLLAVTRVIAKGQYRGHAPMEIAQTLAHLGLLRLDEPTAGPVESAMVPPNACARCGKPHKNVLGFRDGIGWHSWESPRQARGGVA